MMLEDVGESEEEELGKHVVLVLDVEGHHDEDDGDDVVNDGGVVFGMADEAVHGDEVHDGADGAHDANGVAVDHHLGGRGVLHQLLLALKHELGQVLEDGVELGKLLAQLEVVPEEDEGGDLEEGVVGDDGEVVRLGEHLALEEPLVELLVGAALIMERDVDEAGDQGDEGQLDDERPNQTNRLELENHEIGADLGRKHPHILVEPEVDLKSLQG